MRLVCPSCQSAYEVPEARLAHGPQRLRCARCGHRWSFTPPSLPDAAESGPARPAAPLPGVRSRAATPHRVQSVALPSARHAPPTASRGIGPVIGWVLSFALLAGLALASWHWRQPIMAAWPPSERVFRLFGGA